MLPNKKGTFCVGEREEFSTCLSGAEKAEMSIVEACLQEGT